METQTIILTAFSLLFAVIGFLIVDKLSTIDRSLAKLSDKLDDQSDVINDHAQRLATIEAQHKMNH